MAYVEPKAGEASTAMNALTEKDYGKDGLFTNRDADLTVVVGAARKAEAYITNKQWSLLWRDADLLYQSPRPLTTYENTYILEPNVQRFTVAKVANAVVPQLYKGLFYTQNGNQMGLGTDGCPWDCYLQVGY